MDAPDTMLTVPEVADLFRVSKQHVYALIAERAFTVQRFGKSIRVRSSVACDYLARTAVPAADADTPGGSAA